jgi:heme/copper-type cytochrome/quinol oxidase subunit 2
VLENLVILLIIAGLLGGFSLFLFFRLQRKQRRAPWRREAGIQNNRRLERRTFVIAVCVVLVLVAGIVALQLSRRPSCVGRFVIITGPGGTKLECTCERGRLGVCFDPGP